MKFSYSDDWKSYFGMLYDLLSLQITRNILLIELMELVLMSHPVKSKTLIGQLSNTSPRYLLSSTQIYSTALMPSRRTMLPSQIISLEIKFINSLSSQPYFQNYSLDSNDYRFKSGGMVSQIPC